MLTLLKTSPVARSLASALLGLIVYGAWAFLVNYMEGKHAAIMAACTQGTFSFVITLILNGVMEGLYKKVQHANKAKLITITITCLMLYASSYGINYLAGTPNIILTILPGAIASSIYIWAYVFSIEKLSIK